MKVSQIEAMSRRIVINFRLKKLVLFCSFLILVLSLTLVYRSLNSKAPLYHRLTSEKVSIARHTKQPVSYMDTVVEEFQKDLIFADLIPQKAKKHKDVNFITRANKYALLDFFKNLQPENWVDVVETDEVSLELKHLLIDCDLGSKMSCQQIDTLIVSGQAQRTGSKYVEHAYEQLGLVSGTLLKRELVIKSVARISSAECLKRIHSASVCAAMDDVRLLKEVFLLSTLKHPGIISMKGFCLRGNQVSYKIHEKGIVAVMEMGIPLSASVLDIASWSQRVSMALQVAKLLLYLETSPLGSLRMTTLDLQDFVLVRGTLIKLVDLDSLELGNKSCTDDADCQLEGAYVGVKCINKFCPGLNPSLNLYITTRAVLKRLLQNPPRQAETILIDRLDTLNISTKELVAELSHMFSKSPPSGPVLVIEPSTQNRISSNEEHNKGGNLRGNMEGGKIANVVARFNRYNSKSFVSLYDYHCNGTIAFWGCVFTVTSLAAGANLCLQDERCQAFVAFSSHPEAENIMTVILKNATDTKPSMSPGTTLFIKLRQEKSARNNISGNVWQTEQQWQDGNHSLADDQSSFDVQTCLSQAFEDQASIRNSLEKRLMNHLGQKVGLREQAWKKAILERDLKIPPSETLAQGFGGKFTLNFADLPGSTEKMVQNVMFISETGPRLYHQGYALLYQLDRILGLYHTPPCVGKLLPPDVVRYYRRSLVWDEAFRFVMKPDGALSGVFVIPPPNLVKEMMLTLEPLRIMTSEVKVFDRSLRQQLEYILLMWMGKMDRLSDTLGYKDHWIHVNGDAAFSSPGTDMSGFLNHCQFPSKVYSVLQCFRCDTWTNTANSKVCSFGEEVVRRTRDMFPDESEIFIQSLKQSDLVLAMNSAASSVLHIVNTCISSFGQHSVLY